MAFSLMSVSRRTCSAHALALLAALLLAAPLAAQSPVFGVGGPASDLAVDVAVDANSNVVMTGSFTGTLDFDPGPGTMNLTSTGYEDAFVARYTPEGRLISAIGFGSPRTTHGGVTIGRGVTVDASGNTIVTGSFNGTVDFDPGPGTLNLTSSGSYGGPDAFVARYTAEGALISAFDLSGTDVSSGSGHSVGVDASGNVVVTGYFFNTVDFDPGPGTTNLTSAGEGDVFVARYTATGELVSAIRFGDQGHDIAHDVAVDPNGNAVVMGTFAGTVDFDPGPSITNLTAAQSPSSNGFVARYTATGAFVSAIRFSASARSVAVDASGNAVVTGAFAGTVDFDPGPGTFNLTSAGRNDVFVAWYASSGALISAVAFGSSELDGGLGVAVDASGNAVVTGAFWFTVDFDPGPGTTNLVSAGRVDVFVARYSLVGTLVSAIRFGGPVFDEGRSVSVDASGNAVVMGYFNGTADFDPGPGVTSLTSAGYEDVFVARYTPSGALMPLHTSGEDVPVAASVQVSEIAPNPSRGSSRLTLTVERAQPVVVSVYDVLGRRVAVPFAGMASPEQQVAVELSGLIPGAYVVHIVGNTFRSTRRFVRLP